MSDTQIVVPSSRVEEVRKIIFSLKLSEIQELFYKVPPLPPTKEVVIRVTRDPQNPQGRILQIKPEVVSLTTKEQVAWTCPDGRLEIRFSRAANPFLGDMFEVARGGKAYSGTPAKRITKEQTFKYSILVTTPDGFFLSKEVPLVVTPAYNSDSKRARRVTK